MKRRFAGHRGRIPAPCEFVCCTLPSFRDAVGTDMEVREVAEARRSDISGRPPVRRAAFRAVRRDAGRGRQLQYVPASRALSADDEVAFLPDRRRLSPGMLPLADAPSRFPG